MQMEGENCSVLAFQRTSKNSCVSDLTWRVIGLFLFFLLNFARGSLAAASANIRDDETRGFRA